tara:strand:+ start:55 stop:291 length:237 start_codon:yes stop_codon:yes gene_type:complete
MGSLSGTESSEVLASLWHSVIKQLKNNIASLSVFFVVETNGNLKEALDMVLIKIRQILIYLRRPLLLKICLLLVVYSL